MEHSSVYFKWDLPYKMIVEEVRRWIQGSKDISLIKCLAGLKRASCLSQFLHIFKHDK